MAQIRLAEDTLESFARRIETRLRKAGATDSMEREFCRLFQSKQTSPVVKAAMLHRWTEWRFGKAKETIQVTGHIEHEHFDASKLSDEQLAEAERLIESANVGNNQG